MNNKITQELDFVYICNGKKFISKKEAIKYQKSLNSKHFNFFK